MTSFAWFRFRWPDEIVGADRLRRPFRSRRCASVDGGDMSTQKIDHGDLRFREQVALERLRRRWQRWRSSHIDASGEDDGRHAPTTPSGQADEDHAVNARPASISKYKRARNRPPFTNCIVVDPKGDGGGRGNRRREVAPRPRRQDRHRKSLRLRDWKRHRALCFDDEDASSSLRRRS